jgi:hypothetical protein
MGRGMPTHLENPTSIPAPDHRVVNRIITVPGVPGVGNFEPL